MYPAESDFLLVLLYCAVSAPELSITRTLYHIYHINFVLIIFLQYNIFVVLFFIIFDILVIYNLIFYIIC